MTNTLSRSDVSSVVCDSLKTVTDEQRIDPEMQIGNLGIDSNDTVFLGVEIESGFEKKGIKINAERMQEIVRDATADRLSTVNDVIGSICHELEYVLLNNTSVESF